jgi:glycosyltransferase involved in cell wall biosynthesis
MKASAKEKVTVVIPARNEVQSIGDVIRGALKHSARVLVVDGHSTDGTADAARAAGADVILDRTRGKGDAIRCSIAHIATPVAVFMDADGSHDPDDIPKLVAPILEGDAEHVSGSRMLGGSSELHGSFDEFFRLAGNAFVVACINWKFGVSLSESQNGFRALRTDLLRRLDLREDITTIEQEMIIRTLKLGGKLGEVPTHEHRRRFSESSIKVHRVWHRYLVSAAWNLFVR